MPPPLPARKQNTVPAFAEDDTLLADLKAQRKAQQEATRRMEELKMRLFQITERHMDQAINLIRNWLQKKG